ncbi:MAG TPA: hypothetical protein PKA21_16365 [Kiritimatiellia bacterium]|nr:hypothetical protein [Kiritimatiellia bacterium]
MFKQPRHSINFLAVVMLSLVTAGCASVDPQVVQAQTRGKSIAVASSVGSDLQLRITGITIFETQKGTVAVPAWELADLVVKTANSEMQATQRYSSVTTYTNISRVDGSLPSIPPGFQADYLLLIESRDCGDPMFGTKESSQGIGIAQTSVLGLKRAKAHIFIRAELFDLSVGKSVGERNRCEHWDINTELKSGGSFKFTGAYRVPIIDERDLTGLQEPITTRLEKAVRDLLGEMGLR